MKLLPTNIGLALCLLTIGLLIFLSLADLTISSTGICLHGDDEKVTGQMGRSAVALSDPLVEDDLDLDGVVDDIDAMLFQPTIFQVNDEDNATFPMTISAPASTIDTMGTMRELPRPIKTYIDDQPELYRNSTGATNKKVKDRHEFKGERGTPCVACRLNCMNLGVFAACEKKYYFYGCQKKAPCITKETAKEHHVHTSIGICIDRNGCVLKKLKNIFYYKHHTDKHGNEKRKKIKVVPRLPRVYRRVLRLANKISDE